MQSMRSEGCERVGSGAAWLQALGMMRLKVSSSGGRTYLGSGGGARMAFRRDGIKEDAQCSLKGMHGWWVWVNLVVTEGNEFEGVMINFPCARVYKTCEAVI